MVQFVFTTAEDFRVCPTCASMAGLIYNPAEDLPDIPVHSNCRCRYILFNESQSSLLPYIPIALTPIITKVCPEGYHWDNDQLGCVPDDEEL